MGQIGFTQTESVAQVQADLQLSADDSDPNIVAVYNNVSALWESYTDKAVIFPRLQYYYTLWHAAKQLQGALREYVDATQQAGNAKLNQIYTNAVSIVTKAYGQIEILERKAQASRPAVVGQITAAQNPRCSGLFAGECGDYWRPQG